MKEEPSVKDVIKYILIGVFFLVAFIIVLGSFYTVGAGERGILLTWGAPDAVAQESGLHFKVPIMQSVVKIDVKTQKYDADASAASKDLQIVSTKIAVNYHLNPETVPRLYQDVGLDYQNRVIQPAVQEVVKSSTGKFAAEELITKREAVKLMIDDSLKERLTPYGIIMETTSITNFDYSAEFNKAIEAKVTLEQNAIAEKNRLQMIEFQAKQRVAEATGAADSLKVSKDAESYGNKQMTDANAYNIKQLGEAEAYSKKVVADSEAYSLRLNREELSKAPALIEYQLSKSWDGRVAQYNFGGSTTPIINLGATGIVPVER